MKYRVRFDLRATGGETEITLACSTHRVVVDFGRWHHSGKATIVTFHELSAVRHTHDSLFSCGVPSCSLVEIADSLWVRKLREAQQYNYPGSTLPIGTHWAIKIDEFGLLEVVSRALRVEQDGLPVPLIA